VFENVNFSIAKGEFVCVIGHSGCGKSTILNILAGLDESSDGVVIMDGREVSGPSLDRGVIFQNHSLLPWKSALRNVTFAVQARWRDWSKQQVLEHSLRYLELVGLKGAEARRPEQLSGGMRQRVGIARAFAIQPKLLLMDEPFGALDALTRGMIQEELIRVWEQTHQTVFMITHDVDEAILLADRVLLMTNGPNAVVAESVAIDIPRPRDRTQIIHRPEYYAIRNHLVEFLVKRSKSFRDRPPEDYDPGQPPVVRPGLGKAAKAATSASRHQPSAHRGVHHDP
jgi:nitrate/nitrite transport system ATP-binding protein